MIGTVVPLPDWKQGAFGAILITAFSTALFHSKRKRLTLAGKLFFDVNAKLGSSLIAWTTLLGILRYQSLLTGTFWGVLILIQLLALIVLLIETIELAEVVWIKRKERYFTPLNAHPLYQFPKVSIHLLIHNEPPEMVFQTLDASRDGFLDALRCLILLSSSPHPLHLFRARPLPALGNLGSGARRPTTDTYRCQSSHTWRLLFRKAICPNSEVGGKGPIAFRTSSCKRRDIAIYSALDWDFFLEPEQDIR